MGTGWETEGPVWYGVERSTILIYLTFEIGGKHKEKNSKDLYSRVGSRNKDWGEMELPLEKSKSLVSSSA